MHQYQLPLTYLTGDTVTYRRDTPEYTLTYQGGWQKKLWDTHGIVIESRLSIDGVPVVNMTGVNGRPPHSNLIPRRALLTEKKLNIFQPIPVLGYNSPGSISVYSSVR